MALPQGLRGVRAGTVLIAGLALFLLASRLYDLGGKPYHHDESLHATYSWKYAEHGNYRFDPMLHGPLLYHLQAGLFEVLPANDVTGRLSIALISLLFPLIGIGLFRHRPKEVSVLWLAMITLSPTLCFYSRFLNMDLLLITLAFGLLTTSIRWWETGSVRLFYTAVSLLALMVCTKLNFLFYAFAFATFLPIAVWKERGRFVRMLIDLRWHWISGLILFAAIFYAFYSSLGRNPGGVLDALYREMIPYWVKQNRQQRIKGPFDYYAPMLAIYELPLLLGWLWALSRMALNKRLVKLSAGALLATAILFAYCRAEWPALLPTFTRLHLEEPWHPPLALLGVAFWIISLLFHIRRGEIFAAFAAHWLFVSLLLYSYVGEKVPWLATHIIAPLTVYLALVIVPVIGALRKRSFAFPFIATVGIAFALWQGWITWRSSIIHSADPRERLVYTHTSTEIQDLVRRIDRFSEEVGEGENLKIQVVGHSAWPFSWYLRNYRRWYYKELAPEIHPEIAIADWTEQASAASSLPDYTMLRVKLREWWVPKPTDATFENCVRYYFTREVFNPIGSQDIAVFIRTNRMPLWR